MTSRKLTGTILNKNSQKRYSGATVNVEKDDRIVLINSTDKCGNFEFDIQDELKFPTGTYLLTAFHPEAFQENPLEVKLVNGVEPAGVNLELIDKEQTSRLAGIVFTIVLCILSMLILLFYFHWRTNDKDKLHYQLPHLIQTAIEKVPLTDSIQQDTGKIKNDSILLLSLLATIDSVARNSYEQDKQTDSIYSSTLKILLKQAKDAVETKQYSYLTILLNSIDKYETDRIYPFIWGSRHQLMIEIYIWALMATFLRLMAQASYYVRRGSFEVNGITHKAALIFTIPILAVIVSLILSYLKFSFQIGNSSLNLDLSDRVISILIAVLIGLAPWKTWDFMNGLSDTLFDKLKGLTSSAKNNAQSNTA